MVNNKGFGIRKEREYKNKRLKEKGVVFAVRSAASLGVFDICLLKKDAKNDTFGTLELISLKASRSKSQVKRRELGKIRSFIVPKTLEVVKKLAVWENRGWKEYV